jgi:hypothetical protein
MQVELPSDPNQLFVDFEKTISPGETLHANLDDRNDPFGPSDLRDDDFLPSPKPDGAAAGKGSLVDLHISEATGGDSGSIAERTPGSQPTTPGRSGGGGVRGGLSQALGRVGSNKGLVRVGSRGNLHKGTSHAALGEALGEPGIWKVRSLPLQLL